MIEINLLPWRYKKRRQARRNKAIAVTTGVLLGILAWVIIHISLSSYLNRLRENTSFLRNEIEKTQITADQINQLKNSYDRLMRRNLFLQKFQNKQKNSDNAVKEIVSLQTLPIKLSAISHEENLLTMVGETDSLSHLRLLANAINQANYLSHARLKELHQSLEFNTIHFILLATLKQEDAHHE